MTKYYQDIFYDTSHLSLKKIKDLLVYAKSICHEWRVDILDCHISFARQRIEMSFDDILQKLDKDTYVTCIHRRGYEEWKDNEYFQGTWCMELGFRTMTSPDYFLWIYCDEKQKDNILGKYNLDLL